MKASIILKPTREKSLLRKHPWVFEGAIEKVLGKPHSGGTVDILASDGTWLAKAAYSPYSQIRARVWSFDSNTIIDDNFFKNCLLTAQAKRQAWLAKAETDAYRLIAGESDGLPGITIDVYVDVVVIQVLSAGGEKHKGKLINALKKLFPDACIHERSDVEVRKKEGLDLVVKTHVGELPERVIITEFGIKLEVDLQKGHKTGFYLDQRTNRQITGQYCRGKKVLNCFSYSGGFAVHAAKQGARHITNLDVSQTALDTSERNISLNMSTKESKCVEHLRIDVFEQLRHYAKSGDKFDVIIMDPPKFIDNKRQLITAARGYKDINRLACEILNTGGLLITFSCSGLMPSDLFNKVIADAALDANANMSIVQRLHQDYDHLVSTNFPEGYYLKGLVCIKH